MFPQAIQAFVGIEFVVLLVLAYVALCAVAVAGVALRRLVAAVRAAAVGSERAGGAA